MMSENGKLVAKLMAATVGMFLFGFALVPLYDVFCSVTGLNGKVALERTATESSKAIDVSRSVTVQMIAVNNEQMPWRFVPNQPEVALHPGESVKATFRVENLTNQEMTGQAIPSVSPAAGARYLKKIQCFCFDSQTLAAGEKKDMAVIFTVDPEMPKSIHKLTLSYTIFDITASNAVSSR